MTSLQVLTDARRKTHSITKWDMWVLNPKNYTLTNTCMNYEIDLDNIQNAADMLAWTFQLSGKNPKVYGGDSYLFELTCAFKAIFAYSARDSWNSRKVVDAYMAAEGKRRRCSWLAL